MRAWARRTIVSRIPQRTFRVVPLEMQYVLRGAASRNASPRYTAVARVITTFNLRHVADWLGGAHTCRARGGSHLRLAASRKTSGREGTRTPRRSRRSPSGPGGRIMAAAGGGERKAQEALQIQPRRAWELPAQRGAVGAVRHPSPRTEHPG